MPAGLGCMESELAGRDARRWSLGLTNLDLSDAGQFPSARASRLGEPRSDGKLAGVTAISVHPGRA